MVLLSIPDESLGDVKHILGRLKFHRGWESQVVFVSTQDSAAQAVERCGAMLRQDVLSRDDALTTPAFQYPATEREVSLLIPDREDATGGDESADPQGPSGVMAGPPRLTLQDKLRLRRLAAHPR